MKRDGKARFSFVVDPAGYDDYSCRMNGTRMRDFWKEWNDNSLPVFEPEERTARRKRRDD